MQDHIMLTENHFFFRGIFFYKIIFSFHSIIATNEISSSLLFLALLLHPKSTNTMGVSITEADYI